VGKVSCRKSDRGALRRIVVEALRELMLARLLDGGSVYLTSYHNHLELLLAVDRLLTKRSYQY
jgi:hypothetical protein